MKSLKQEYRKKESHTRSRPDGWGKDKSTEDTTTNKWIIKIKQQWSADSKRNIYKHLNTNLYYTNSPTHSIFRYSFLWIPKQTLVKRRRPACCSWLSIHAKALPPGFAPRWCLFRCLNLLCPRTPPSNWGNRWEELKGYYAYGDIVLTCRSSGNAVLIRQTDVLSAGDARGHIFITNVYCLNPFNYNIFTFISKIIFTFIFKLIFKLLFISLIITSL